MENEEEMVVIQLPKFLKDENQIQNYRDH